MATIQKSQHDVSTRLQALALLEIQVPIAVIIDVTGISKSSIYGFRKTAVSRGYNPQESLKLLLKYVSNAP